MKLLSFRNLVLAVGCIAAWPLSAQVSHGGQPLPLASLRSTKAESQLFQTLPAFDLQEQLRIDSLEQTDLRNGLRFAYKFLTDYTPDNAGIRFTTADGTSVWRLGIHSPGALSINVLFSEYHLPEGAQLFLYDAKQRQVLGAFNHLNNSELGLLPVAPIEGDSLIIEYQEPANAPFRGRLRIGEVNHGYRSLRGLEPIENNSANSASPAVVCYQDSQAILDQIRRSVVLLVVDGTVGCTATLINNSNNDGKPYLLTASHCLNKQFQLKNPDYEEIAGRIVCFYQYESPFCGSIRRGTEELTTASAHFRAVDERGDMALLELLETPPVYYQPFYAGWDLSEMPSGAPFIGIHHPQYSVKRFCSADEIEASDFKISAVDFYDRAHWHVPIWQVGYTYAGSSGSPLFNAQGEVIGALTGGNSTSSSPKDDYYFRLSATWNRQADPARQLKHWLNPTGDNRKSCASLDPYAASPAYRLSNIAQSGRQEEAEVAYYDAPSETPLFGNNELAFTGAAEAYQTHSEAILHGVYLVTPPCGKAYANMEVEVTVYDGHPSPSTLLYKERFKPSYTHYQSETFTSTPKSLDRTQESFIHFAQPVTVNGTFYVGYQWHEMPEGTHFAAYSLPKGITSHNTAWLKAAQGWQPATTATGIGYSTALFVDPVVQYVSQTNSASIAISAEQPLLAQEGPGLYRIWLPHPEAGATYQLFTSEGRSVEGGVLHGADNTLRLSSGFKGIYLLTIRQGQQKRTWKIRL